MSATTRMLQSDPHLREKLEQRQSDLIQKAQQLAKGLRDDKERQLRNVQAIAEQGRSWTLVELFIRYQAARKQFDPGWAEQAVRELGALRNMAQAVVAEAGQEGSSLVDDVHTELVKRVLGYTVWWHVWEVKGKANEKGERR
jgi:hypothetical protein